MTSFYFDNNATTAVHPEVAAVMAECYRAGWGNPASAHFAGRRARRALEDARAGIAEILGARCIGMQADQVIFTSGGTEANHLALRGIVSRQPQRVIISAIEHPSLRGAAEQLAQIGHEVKELPVDSHGIVRVNELPGMLNPRTRLLSVMLGNNETGVVQPVAELASVCRNAGVLMHTDAVQCAGKIPVRFAELNVDALSVSAHKFHGPVGIGALLMRHGVAIEPLIVGGFQQAGIRPGTESVALAVGMHRALQLWQSSGEQHTNQLCHVRDLFEQTLKQECPEICINGAGAERLPQTSNIAFLGFDRQALVMAFDAANIACSTGSACASGSSEPSPVLRAMDLSPAIVNSSIRFSFSIFTTAAEVLQGAQHISQIVNDLRLRGKSPTSVPTPPKPVVSPV